MCIRDRHIITQNDKNKATTGYMSWIRGYDPEIKAQFLIGSHWNLHASESDWTVRQCQGHSDDCCNYILPFMMMYKRSG